MSVLATLVGTEVSLGALGWLSATDPKRRRTFGYKPAARPAPRWVWALALVPGLLVPVWGGAAGFVLWLGAVSAVGWALVAVSPQRLSAAEGRVAAGWEAVRDRLAPLVRGGVAGGQALVARLRPPAAARPAHGAGVEARLAVLEAEVAALRAELALAAGRGGGADLHLVEGARQIRAG